jgi:hypothetical protein
MSWLWHSVSRSRGSHAHKENEITILLKSVLDEWIPGQKYLQAFWISKERENSTFRQITKTNDHHIYYIA